MRRSLLGGLLGIVVSGAALQAATVSVNFTGGNGGPFSMNAADQAGNPSVAGSFVSNWNNADGAVNNYAGLKDDAAVVTSVAINYQSALGTWSIPTTGGTNLSGGANPTMMRGYLDADDRGSTVSITGLAAFAPQGYKLVIFFDGDNGGSWRGGKYTITNNADLSQLFVGQGEDSENVNFNAGTGNNANGLFQVPVGGGAGNLDWPNSPNNQEGNFLITGDLTADGVTITGSNAFSADITRAPINGFQIIANVPEPGSLAMLGLGAIAVLKRRRK